MKEVFNFLKDEIFISNNDSVIVAVSGGPDSMLLLNLLLELKSLKKINLVCAHVNHNVRVESHNEATFVAQFCKKNDIIFEMMKIENYDKENFHSEARTKRYKYFEEMVSKYNSKYLFTAHHGDDLIETILMRIVRGSTLYGYSGFSKISDMNGYKLIRPLVNVTKEQILKYCADNKIEYVVDHSNQSDKYTRNRFRKNFLPFLKEENPLVHEKFYKFSKLLSEYDDYITNKMLDLLDLVYQNKKIDIDKFSKFNIFEQTRLLNMMLENYYNENLNLINDKHVELLIELIKSKKSNSKIYLPNNIVAIKSYKHLYLKENIEEKNEYNLELKEITNLPNGKNIEKISESIENGNDICRLNGKDIKLPLMVRNKSLGDRIQVKGMNGNKKISDIFIDKKVPVEERDSWPVVVDSNEVIVWLPGLKKSKFDKPKEELYDIILKYY